ncbi:MAG: hypothetical protein GY834_06870 [Bacteroidetes bacterium]|nr:hypothetical protein [Bacteroidota bacterium]
MKLNFIKIWIVLLLIACIGNAYGLDKDEKLVIKAIKSGNVALLKNFLIDRSDVDCAFSNGKSGLYYAIKYNETKICNLLLANGADPDLIVGEHSTLIWAVKYDRRRMIRLLIEYGASVNHANKKGNTPLIYAAKHNNLRVCKLLIDRGADPLRLNNKNKVASDYSIYWELPEIKDYLILVEKQYKLLDTVSSLQDGPYIYWENNEQIVLNYYERIQKENLTRIIEKTIQVGNKDTVVKGIRWDTNSYHIKHNYQPMAYKLNTGEKIFAIGDLHGRYNALIKLLLNHEVINIDLNWNFGKGHLLLLGDVFDRGNMVTELLWFLHELQIEAQNSGGNVHLLLGNHEVMALTGDHRYINSKYDFFNRFTYTNYFQLLEKNTVFGKWLRNQNAIVQINDYLFMHAGISPQFEAKNYTYPSINLELQKFLNSNEQLQKGSMTDVILSSYGPLWFRGYMYSENRISQVPQEFVNNYLKSHGLKRMILGHNEQSAISTSYNGKVVSVDVRINEDGSSAQGLLIIGNKLYRCSADGKKERLE